MEITDTPKPKAHQKRAMFKSRFGALLKAQGFQYHRNRFIRFHRDQVLLGVSMELSRLGEMEICFGGMPLCIRDLNPGLPLGDRISDFGAVHPLPENLHSLPFRDQLDIQAELFEKFLLGPFAEIDSIAALLDYQERIPGYGCSRLPADWIVWECVYLRDYEKARRYAFIWEAMEKEEFEEYCRAAKEAVMAADLNRRERDIRLQYMKYLCKCRSHGVYAAQRFGHLLDLGAYKLLQEEIAENIKAANAAVLDYISKE